MLNFSSSGQNPAQSLEDCIRTALELGELSPVLRNQINNLCDQGVTDRELTLLKILQDAIQDGCIEEP